MTLMTPPPSITTEDVQLKTEFTYTVSNDAHLFSPLPSEVKSDQTSTAFSQLESSTLFLFA